MFGDGDVLDPAGPGHRVIGKTAGQQLSGLRIVDDVFTENLTPALRYRAVHLAFDDGVVDHHAAVVDRHIRDHVGEASLRIDFDFSDMAAVGISRAELAFAGDRQRFFRCQFAQRDFFVRCRRLEFTVRIGHLRRFDAQLLGGERGRVFDQFFRGDVAHRAGADDGARAAGVVADQSFFADALAQRHPFSRDAQRVADDLRKRGFVALALRMRDRIRGQPAIGGNFEQHFVLGEHAGAGVFDHRRKTQAAQQAALLGFGAAFGETGDIRQLQRLVEHAGKIGDVVDRAGRGLVRESIGRNEIAPANFGRVDIHLRRRLIDQTLDRVGDLRTRRAAVGRHRYGIGQGDAPATE